MTMRAVKLCVRAFQFEIGLQIMIKNPGSPRIRVMTKIALIPQRPPVFVGIAVTLGTHK